MSTTKEYPPLLIMLLEGVALVAFIAGLISMLTIIAVLMDAI